MNKEEEKKLLTDLVEHYESEDHEIRERQIRTWRKLKLYWEGFNQIWYSEVAHDWRIYNAAENEGNDQAAYDKQINIFRAYLESIIAALSVTIPPIKCYPDDADNPLDLLTAKAGDKIAKLIYRHNDVSLLWLHSLYIFVTEGMVACYTYNKADKEYGEYEVEKEAEVTENHKFTSCTSCGEDISEEPVTGDFVEEQQVDPTTGELIGELVACPACGMEMVPIVRVEEVTSKQIVGMELKPKSRQCIEMYGGLYVKIANYAKKQADTPYLMLSYETDYTFARDRYGAEVVPNGDSGSSHGGGNDQYERMGRSSLQYGGDLPRDNVTIRSCWLRPSAFNFFTEESECKFFKKKFPSGVRVVMVEDKFAEAVEEKLDDHWTLTYNPLSDHLYHDPLGQLLINIQDITTDLVSLVLQTIEHGIPQTFADPRVLDFPAYSKAEATPGAIIRATPVSGKSMGDAFYEVKTATLSQEILPFAQEIQQYGQMVSGALPSLFGGQMTGSKTASEYSMSRAQALQRLQNTWKVFTVWWKAIFGKAIPGYIALVKEDEKYVEQDSFGNFINVFIRKAELEGKIGKVELEANENLPITWAQQKDVIMQLLQSNNPEILALLAQPENLHLIYQAIGIDQFHIPAEADRIKQYDEIKELLNSEPIVQPPPEPDEIMMMQIEMGEIPPPEPIELPSVDVDPILDNHQVEFAVIRGYLVGEAGRLAKVENPNGYKNCLLHAMAHFQIMNQQMMEQQMMAPPPEGEKPPREKPKQDMKAPIKGEENVSA